MKNPPHPKHLDKSFPVPRGMIAIGVLLHSGNSVYIKFIIEPIVPSPPATMILQFFSF